MAYVGPFPLPVSSGGTGDSTITANAVLIGDGIGTIDSTNVGTNGQLLIGATGADPAFSTLTSTGGTIVFTPGANTLNLESSGTTAASFPTDSGTATPSLGALTIAGGNNIITTGVGSTVTIDLNGATNHAVQVGNVTGSLTSLSIGTNGQVLLGATAADPSFITPTAGNGLAVTTNASTLSYALSAPVSIANGGTNATSMAITDGTVIFNGTSLATTATGTSGQVLTSNGAGVAPTYQTVSSGGFSWSEVTGTSSAMAINNGYIANNVGLVTLTLPATAALGSIFEVTGKGTGGWLVAQNSGQTLFFGTSTTTPGATGSLASTQQRDSIRFVCVTANNDFNVLSSIGSITVV